MKILLVNDDGLESPALLPTIKELEKIGDVETIVPRYQQSWTSKSNIRRRRNLKISVHKVSEYDIIALDALPADCANYGIFANDDFPDLLVSGANVGHNVGLAAFYSSGTVGAALEGLLVGIPSVAISVPYLANSSLVSDDFHQSIMGVSSIIDQFYHVRESNFAMMMLNIPYAKKTKKLMATTVEIMNFGSLFYKDSDGLVQPMEYPRLYYPTAEELTPGSDAWAREHDITSLVVLSNNGAFVDPEVVDAWLSVQDLGSQITFMKRADIPQINDSEAEIHESR